MPAQVTIKSGIFNLVLPDGGRYQAGQTATLTDEQLGQISAQDAAVWFTAVLFAPGAQTLGDPDSEAGTAGEALNDSAIAPVNTAGAAVIGGIVGTAAGQVTAANVPYFVRDQQDECSSGRSGMLPAGGFGTDAVDTTYTDPVTYAGNP
jgi:hypothetical protein